MAFVYYFFASSDCVFVVEKCLRFYIDCVGTRKKMTSNWNENNRTSIKKAIKLSVTSTYRNPKIKRLAKNTAIKMSTTSATRHFMCAGSMNNTMRQLWRRARRNRNCHESKHEIVTGDGVKWLHLGALHNVLLKATFIVSATIFGGRINWLKF